MSYEVIRSNDYLEHFGIKGMHWGEWNEETRARYFGGSKRSGQVGEDGKPRRRGLTDKQKKYIKAGATVAATILVAYGGYKLTTNPNVRAIIGKGLDFLSKSKKTSDLLNDSAPIFSKNGKEISQDSEEYKKIEDEIYNKFFGLQRPRS